MIKNKILTLLFGLAVMFSVTSCEDYFGDINVNPNAPTDVTPQVLLPSIQVRLAYTVGGDFSRFTAMLMQQTEGVARQWSSYNQYGFNPSQFNTAWRTNTYAGTLADIRALKAKTEEGGYRQYTGVAKVLEAYTWMTATDVWGDMPYTEAFQGTEVLQPAFDSQEFIYSEIFRLLAEADADLAAEDGGLPVGTEDVIYGGEIADWQGFAQAVRAKANLHLAEVDGTKYYTAALTAARAAMTDATGNAYLPFGEGPTESAPWYQFNRDRTGDIQIGPKMVELTIGDPRGDVYSPDFIKFADQPFMVADRNWPFATYTEMKFIEAEALMMTGGSDSDIHAAFTAAVEADFVELGLDTMLYVDYVDALPTEGNVTLENIITQKYIALHTEVEVYNDWRRTGFPILTPVSGQFVPVRFPYGETEILFNENTPAVDFVTDKVWWDR